MWDTEQSVRDVLTMMVWVLRFTSGWVFLVPGCCWKYNLKRAKLVSSTGCGGWRGDVGD